jgi:hypothetical protein
MNTREWQRLLAEHAKQGKLLFTVTELANASGVPRGAVNVEMARLVKYGVVVRYARGLYGLPDTTVPPEKAVQSLDALAYVTGAYALMRHGLITQVPSVITAFTTQRHFNRELQAPVGRLRFVCVQPPVYSYRASGMAEPEQALCDFVYLCRRRGTDPSSLVTPRGRGKLRKKVLARIVKRYPATVGWSVAAFAQGGA